MEENNTKTQADGTMLFAGDAWFDPIETGIRDRVRGFIEELLEQELTAALARAARAGGGRACGVSERSAEAPAARLVRPGGAQRAAGAHGNRGRGYTGVAQLQPDERDWSMRVLLIEDDEQVRTFLSDTLIDEGFDVDSLANAEDALVLLGAGQVPDVLVTDIHLGPGLDGIDLADVARVKHPDVGVVFISGESCGTRGHCLGAHERFLRKPFSSSSLTEVIRDTLKS
jgi:CheY-like chemotaxis protein